MRIRPVAAVLSAGALALGIAGGALAVTPSGTLDQSHECGAANCNTNGGALYPFRTAMQPGSSPQDVSLGQTFTAGVTGTLNGVEIYVSTRDTTVDPTFTIQIERTTAGKPDGTILGSAAVSTTGIGSTPVWAAASFASPIAITKGTVYAITLAPIAERAQNQAFLSWELDSTANAAYTDYAGGEAFAFATTSGWMTAGSAIFDTSSAVSDFAFRTYATAASTPTPKPRVTAPPTSTIPPGDVATPGSKLPLATAFLAIASLILLTLVSVPARRRR